MNLKLAQEFLTRCFAPEETIALLLRSEATAKVTQRIVTVRQADCSSISRMARLRKYQRRKHLCSRQSTSLRQQEADEGEHRIGTPYLHRCRHGRRGPNCGDPVLRSNTRTYHHPLHIAR